ncbi:Y-family DNA polymerase [Planctomycetota bacterium]
MQDVFALVDCNNFYVSCERVFNPRLAGRPVIVMSNNDGCVVSRSNETKALGVKMGVAVFEIKDFIRKHEIQTYSSNYTLYADMSNRIMETLASLCPQMEVYSIDEAFLNLAGMPGSLEEVGRKIRTTIQRWTGIPVTVGIASTKTLAKLANGLAKKSAKAQGVLNLYDSPYLEYALSKTPVEKVWNVGIRTTIKLKKRGITTALALRDTEKSWIRQVFGVVGLRTVYELEGTVCYDLEENPATRQSVSVSRMFGQDVKTLEELQQAIATYAARAGEKLRQNGLAAGMMTVYVTTSRFIKHRYFNSKTIRLDAQTNNSVELIRAAVACIMQIFRQGYAYKKCGIVMYDLAPENRTQLGLFDHLDQARIKRLMKAIDTLNHTLDKPIRWAAEGLNPPWAVQFNRRSPRYTTQWDELMVV